MADNLAYRSKPGDDPANDDNDSDDEEIDETGYKSVKDAVLFAIEVSDSMLERPSSPDSKRADTNSPLLATLKCAYHLMQQRIISNPKDLIGILLYGTEASKFYDEDESTRGGWSFPHCYLLTDLEVPEADDVKKLKSIVEDEGSDGVAQLFKPAKEPMSMHTVLFCANQVFQQRASNFTSRRLFIVTDNDNPHPDNNQFRSQATVRAKDLYDLGVIIELFPISTPSHEFDTQLFYNDIIYKAAPTDPDAIAYNPTSILDVDMSKLKSGSSDGIDLLQSLLTTIASKNMAKRALFSSVPLELGPNLRISVKGYLLFKHQKPARSCYIYLESETPQIAKASRTQIADGGMVVEKPEIRKAFTFGGEKILFTQEEFKKLRDFGEPIIRIIGFKPMSRLPLWANTKNSIFLYPSEEDYVGSTRVYSALHQKLAKDQIFGLCWFIPRRNATPVMAAMIPTLSEPDTDEKRNPAGVSITGVPQGLHLIPLPFADDIRQNPPLTHENPVRAPDSLVDAMRPIVQQLNLPKGIYDASRYPNPSLQWHYRILQAIALEEDLPEKPEDKTIPKHKQIDKRVGNETMAWGMELERVYKEYLNENPDAVDVGAKRVAGLSSGGGLNGDSGAKKIKTESGDGGITEEEMRSMWQKQRISNLTVVQLKEFCTIKRLSVQGKKADLIQRVEQWFENR
jgi:ATP-dependent DNA helicase 2 subunit 1